MSHFTRVIYDGLDVDFDSVQMSPFGIWAPKLRIEITKANLRRLDSVFERGDLQKIV